MRVASRRTGVRAAFGAVIAIMAMAGVAHAQYPGPTLERALSAAAPDDLAEGKRLYNAQCALCHGIDGSGGYGPSLLTQAFARASDDAGLFALVVAGIPGLMPGFGEANGPKKSWQLAAFVRSMRRDGGSPVHGNAATGQVVYQKRGCATCHVVAGEGRAFGPDLTTIGLQRGPAYLRQALVEPGARVPDGHVVVTATPRSGPPVRGIRLSEDAFWIHVRDLKGQLHAFRVADLIELKREAGASLMPTFASLAPAELDDLVAYLSSLRGRR